MTTFAEQFHERVSTRLEALTRAASEPPFTRAVELIADAIQSGGVVHAFGTGHSEAFAMEIAGRAGGLIPTSKIALRDVVIHGSHAVSELGTAELERDPSLVDELWEIQPHDSRDIYLIASNSGVNGSIVGFAQKVKSNGHNLIAVTSLAHTMAVTPKHPSGLRLCEIADVTLDNLAPFGDVSLNVTERLQAGAISSITSAFIAQLITISVTSLLHERGIVAPLYISANIPGGDAHNDDLLSKYAGRLRRDS